MSIENLRKPWTTEDDKRLRELIDSGLQLPAVARELRRTPHGVKYRAIFLGLNLRTEKPRTKK